MPFYPDLCRNESEVESKLIVQYLLPKLGYSPDNWHQEVVVGSIRLDFLVFAAQVIPFVFDATSPLSVVIEAKHPKQNLNNHVRRLRRYLTSLNVQYGLLTNGKEIRIFERVEDDVLLVFQCSGKEVNTKIDEIKALIGRDSLKEKNLKNFPGISHTHNSTINTQPMEAVTIIAELNVIQPELPSEQLLDTPGDDGNFLNLAEQELQRIEQLYNANYEQKREHTVKTIAVYHNKGGVGKTTTVVNLAAALRKKGKKVLLIDLDSQANTTFATGLIQFDDEDLDDIKDCNILHVLQSEEFYPIQEVARKSQFNSPEIDVVPSHINLMHNENDLNSLDGSRLVLLDKLDSVKNKYDIVIIDTPPSLNLYARIALITADYLIIPSDLKPFANQGLVNVKDFVKKNNVFRKQIGKPPIEILGVLACKISTNAKFVQNTLKKRIEAVEKRYQINLMNSVIYERDDLAKCAEQVQIVGDTEIAAPRSVLDFKPDSISAQEFELLAIEVLTKIGMN